MLPLAATPAPPSLPGYEVLAYVSIVLGLLALLWKFVLWPLFRAVDSAPTLLDLAREFRSSDGGSTLKDQLNKIQESVTEQEVTLKVVERKVGVLQRQFKRFEARLTRPTTATSVADEASFMDVK